MVASQQGERRRRPRIYRPRKDILNVYEDAELVKRWRLEREGKLLVCDMVRDAIAPKTNRSKAISVEMKVATTLQYLATGKM